MKIKSIILKKFNTFITKIKSIKKRSIYCVVGGLILSIFSFAMNQSSIYISPYEIERSSYGTQKTPYKLTLDAENLSKNMEFSVSVSARKYEKEEADAKFNEKFEALLISMLNENEDYEHICSNLKFTSDLGDGIRANYSFSPIKVPEYYDKYEIKDSKKVSKKKRVELLSTISDALDIKATESNIEEFRYYVNYKDVVDGSGNVKNDDFKADEFCTGYIEISLSADIKGKDTPYKSEKYMVPIRVIAKPMTPLEAFKVAFKKTFEQNDKDTVDSDTITLPRVVNDFKITYKEKKDLKFLLMPLLGIIVAILLEARDKEAIREKEKKRIRYLELDYTQIVTKILLYVSSGMTIRNSMIRLAEQYQKSAVKEERAAYDELVIVKNKLSSGYSEVKAYEEMAKNINLRTYTRFLNIIIQSIKNGNKDLKNILNMEVQDALYERKQHAKKLGEEAATKLVLPLMMMLAVIMVVIMVPAFMGM